MNRITLTLLLCLGLLLPVSALAGQTVKRGPGETADVFGINDNGYGNEETLATLYGLTTIKAPTPTLVPFYFSADGGQTGGIYSLADSSGEQLVVTTYFNQAITAYATADAGAETEVTSVGHGLANGQTVVIANGTGSGDYNGTHVINEVAADTFEIPIAYNDNPGDGDFTFGEVNTTLSPSIFASAGCHTRFSSAR